MIHQVIQTTVRLLRAEVSGGLGSGSSSYPFTTQPKAADGRLAPTAGHGRCIERRCAEDRHEDLLATIRRNWGSAVKSGTTGAFSQQHCLVVRSMKFLISLDAPEP